MNIRTLNFLLVLLCAFVMISCGDDDDAGSIGGSQSPAGEVGNTFQVSGTPTGISGVSASITDLTDGVSTLSYSVNVSNPTYLDMLASLSGPNIAGSTVTGQGKYRITSKGIESVYNDGTLTLVNYDCKVGDVYTVKHGGATIRREVVSKSTEDDYFWNGMMIKTIAVKETGRNIPGVSNITYYYNHKFVLVGAKMVFEDGSTKQVGIQSNQIN